MGEIYRGRRIYLDPDHNMRECVSPVGFPFDHVLDSRSAYGCSPGFANKEAKFFIRLTHDRRFWLLGKHSDFIREWERYLRNDEDEPDYFELLADLNTAIPFKPSTN